MTSLLTEFEAVSIAERHWNVRFSRVRGARNEYKSDGGCPNCGDGNKGDKSDRFRLFTDGNPRAWCRQCGYQVFINNINGNRRISDIERRQLAILSKQREFERKQTEQEKRLVKLEQLHVMKPHLRYHNALTPEAVEYWIKQGMRLETIDNYMLGYCEKCPSDYDHRPSYTIPVINGGKLYNVRHRIINANDGDKYRPEMAGLGNQLFNLDALAITKKRVILWEGEKKVLVLSQYISDAANVGIMGKLSWKKEWTQLLKDHKDIVIALDPDAEENAYKLGKLFYDSGMRNVRVAHFPLKPDDAIVKYGATEGDIRSIIEHAVPI